MIHAIQERTGFTHFLKGPIYSRGLKLDRAREDCFEEVAIHWATEGRGAGEEKSGWQTVPEKETVCGRDAAKGVHVQGLATEEPGKGVPSTRRQHLGDEGHT